MNFIIKLSESADSIIEKLYNNILMMIDRLTKYNHLISFNEKYSTNQLKFIILNKLIRYHDILKEITSDRDKLFTSNY